MTSSFFVHSGNGRLVYVSEPVASRFSPELTRDLLAEALLLAELIHKPRDMDSIRLTVDLGRTIGAGGVVETVAIAEDTPTTFAIRTDKKHATRVIIGVEKPPTSLLTFVVVPNPRGTGADYKLIVAYIGASAEKEPWDERIETDEEAERALQFWLIHARVYGDCPMGEPFTSTWREVLR